VDVFDRRGFLSEALRLQGSVTPLVAPYVIGFGLVAGVICLISAQWEIAFGMRISIEVAPFEIVGAALTLVLILRTNAGYDRWWEARKLWGGIVNQSRNLAVNALSYGPDDPSWRAQFVRWVAAFPYASRNFLRGEPAGREIAALLGDDAAEEINASAHMPSFVALRMAQDLHDACERLRMDRFAFLQIDRERAMLIDHIGACERILKSPLPLVYAIKIRRFIMLFLFVLPFALLHRLNSDWLVPLMTMFVASPLLSLDRIGVELQNPFSKANLSHLPLDEICKTIETNVMGLMKDVERPQIHDISMRDNEPAAHIVR
jgi:putative membrane protein